MQDWKQDREQIEVKVIEPNGKLYVGYAEAVTAISDKGKFDILPRHSWLVALIRDKVLVKVSRRDVREFKVVGEGVLRCDGLRVGVYLGL